MVKRILTLYVDDERIRLAKERGKNLSQLFNEMLNPALVDNTEQQLQIKLAEAQSQIEELKKLNEGLEKRAKQNDRRFVEVK